MRRVLLAAFAAVILGASPARAGHLDPIEDTAVGVAAFVATAAYAPVKTAANVAFLTVGLPLGLFGWIDIGCLTDGDFVITPGHLRGEKSLHFTLCSQRSTK